MRVTQLGGQLWNQAMQVRSPDDHVKRVNTLGPLCLWQFLERTGPIDRTQGTPGSDKNILSLYLSLHLSSSPNLSLHLPLHLQKAVFHKIVNIIALKSHKIYPD